MGVFRRRPPGPAREPAPWSRRRLVAAAAAVGAVCLVLLVGVGAGVYYALHPSHHHTAVTASGSGVSSAATSPSPASSSASVSAARGSSTPAPSSSAASSAGVAAQDDALAARAMPSASLTQAQPGAAISNRDPGSITLPKPSTTDRLGVATGYPRTPAGAFAAMAAIDKTAFDSGSMAGVRAVIRAWAVPGGPSGSSWSGVKAMASFFDAAGLSGAGAAQLSIVMTPVMGLVKGSVGPDFVVPCVDFEMDATLAQTGRVAVADCERMVWTGGRWMIGAGAEPATPPSVWPDTDDAIGFGYHDLVTTR